MSQAIFPITMPKWGIEMQRGTIITWHVKPGSLVQKGDSLLDVETDKIVNSVESPAAGCLRRIVSEDGSTEDVGALIAVLADPVVTDGEVAEFVSNFKPVDASFEPNDVATAAAPEPAITAAHDGGSGEADARISPFARRAAERLGVDVLTVKGTGRNGRVSKEDVEAYAAGQATAGIDMTPRRAKMSPMRSAIARRLSESKRSIPHYRVEVDVEFDALIAHRKNTGSANPGVTLNDLLVRACAVVLLEHPSLNAQLIEDEILEFQHVDLCVAMATDAGVVAPIVRAADTKSAAAIGIELRALGVQARAGTLVREQIAGGTFTLSNLGMFGVDRFDAIINPPQVSILAVGAVVDRVVARSGAPVVRKMATLTLSADHRAVDGVIATKFLMGLKAVLEAPHLL